MIKCDGLIFDVDGTLWDSTGIVKNAWNDAIIKLGYPNPKITADRLKGLFGLPMDDIIKDILPDSTREERDRFTPLIYEYEDKYLDEKGGVTYPLIIETIEKISKTIPVFIVSNCQAGYIELFMRKTESAEFITDHLCPGDSGVFKAENIRRIVDKHGLKNPYYVGDTIMDFDACKEADCPFIFAKYGFGDAPEAEIIIDKPADLIGLLGI